MIGLYIHLSLMAAATLVMLGAIVIARYFKKKKWWLKAHKALNGASLALALGGFAAAFSMVQESGGPHFRVGHGVVGFIALLLALATPVLGFAIFKTKDKKRIPLLKQSHRWLGRLVALGMASAAILGLSLIGVF
ncbi:MAG: membrane protein [Spirochaetes bacterium]|nr:MAG: membrane protein [Spirochaetota bacterium]